MKLKSVRIVCSSKEEMDHVLKKLEEYGYRWRSGNKPTELNYFGECDCVNVCDYGMLSKGYFQEYNTITGKSFLKSCGYRPIVISVKDNMVIAEDKNTGETGVAKCSPDDTFDFNLGARIAFGRLMGDRVEYLYDGGENTKSDNDADDVKFNKGDAVILRNDLVIGEKYDGLTFYDGRMSENKGKMVILKVSPNGNYYCDNGFYYSGRMLEPYIKKFEDYKVGNIITVKDGLVDGEKYGGITYYRDYRYLYGHIKKYKIIKIDDSDHTFCCERTDGIETRLWFSYEMIEAFKDVEDVYDVGDIVEITDPSYAIMGDYNWVENHVDDIKLRYQYDALGKFECFGDLGRIVAITDQNEHEVDNSVYAYIECDDGICHLFDIRGIKKYE